MMEMERSELEGAEKNAPAVLQLHRWGSLVLPVSAFAKAAFSPSRELLLLQSHDREVVLVPLGGPSNAPNSPSSPPPPASGPETSSLNRPLTSPTPSRTSSSTAAYASNPYGSPPGSPLLQTYVNPSFSPLPSSDSQRNNNSPSPAASPKGLSSVPCPSLCDVDHFAWASYGDGFGSKGPAGLFKELLFTSNREGLFFHCLSPTFRADDDGHVSTDDSQERTGLGSTWREGKWRNWVESQPDSRLDDTAERREGDYSGEGSSQLETAEGKEDSSNVGVNQSSEVKEGLVSYVVEAELEDTSEGLQLRFKGPYHPWPSSAEVVSFKFAVESPSFSLLTSPSSRKASKTSELITSVEIDTQEGLKSEQPVPAGETPDQQRTFEIVDIISNPSHTLVGIVMCQISPEADRQDEGRRLGGQSSVDVRKPQSAVKGNATVAIALVVEWGIKWIALIDLKEAEGRPWASLVLANDRLLGLKEDGGVFMWAALDGRFIAFIDVVNYCEFRPTRLPGEKITIGDETRKVDGESSPDALLIGDGSVPGEAHISGDSAGREPRVNSEASGEEHHPLERHFTSLVVTANCLLLAVTDDQGLLFLVSTDDYFASQTSSPFSTRASGCTEDLRALSYWDLGGSDIGASLPTSLLPDRRCLKPVHDEKDGTDGTTRQVSHPKPKISGGRESGPGPPTRGSTWQVATGFTNKVEVARNGAVNVVSSGASQPIRRVFLPHKRSEEFVAVALSSNAITTMVRPTQDNDEAFIITQNVLRILDGAVDERDFYKKVNEKIDGHMQKRSSCVGDTLPFVSQGFLYMVTATSLHVVLPPLALSSSESASSLLDIEEEKSCTRGSLESALGWDQKRLSLRFQGALSQHWQTEVLDRALVYDGIEEAERLCVENGWSLQLFHLRQLQLAVDLARAEDVKHALEALVHVGAAESGVLSVLFAAVELMLNQYCSDNELAQASTLLSSAASFTTSLVRQHGIRGWQGYSEQHRRVTSESSLKSSRYKTSASLTELARFLEVIRALQVRLQEKRRGPNSRPGDSGRDKVFTPSDSFYVRAPLEAIEEGTEEAVALNTQEQGAGDDLKALSPYERSFGGKPFSSGALVTTSGGFGGTTGSSWELSPTAVEGGASRRRAHIESPSDMVARWENENVDAAGVVRDALKSSGRLALAAAQLHRLRARDDPENQWAEGDVFGQLQKIGRGIVYELFCKGKIPLAMAAVRRLGGDIEAVLRDLALGAVSRFLHAQAVKELQRHASLSAKDIQLFERVSLIEKDYPNSSFWSAYQIQQQEGAHQNSVATGAEMRLVCHVALDPGLNIECGEVDGVVLGSWSMVEDPKVAEEGCNVQEFNSKGYWAAAAVWLQSWDRRTVDRILLEPRLQEQVISWEAKLEFYVARHNWPAVAVLLETVPTSVRSEGVLHVRLDCDDPLSYDPSLPFPRVSDSMRSSPEHAWLDDGETADEVIPKVQILELDLTSICNTSMWQTIEERLARSHTFLRVQWEGTVELMSLFARAGLLFHQYFWGRNTSSRSKDHVTVQGPIKGSKLQKDAIFGIHELVVQHCLKHTLAHFLELYLDFHSLAQDKGTSAIMQVLIGDCQWALWLLYSGLRRREYDASFANALTIIASSPRMRRRLGVADIGNFLPTVDHIGKAGGVIMALSTLMYAPVLVQKCLYTGTSVSRYEGGTWQCTLESLRPGLHHFPTLWATLVGVVLVDNAWGFTYGHPLKAGSKEGLIQYLEWHQSLFSCASGDASLLQMIPIGLPQRVRYLLHLTTQGPAGGGRQMMASKQGSELMSKVAATLNWGSQEASMESLETLVSTWEATIRKTIEEELEAPTSEDASSDCEHHICRGHALSAFNTLLGSRVHNSKDLKSGYGRLHSSEIQALFSPLTANEQKLLEPLIPLVITHYESPVIVAAFAFLVELCGLSANLLRVDIASLRRISKHLNRGQMQAALGTLGTASGRMATHDGDVAGSLAGSLADEYVHAGVKILSSSTDGPQSWRSNKSVMSMLQFLEKASLKDEGVERGEGGSPGAWLFSGQGDGLLLRTMQRSISGSWSLVTAFCRSHCLPFSTTYLETLARDNDWVGFLAEAQLEGCSLDVLLSVVSKEFTNARLQSQLLFVLKNLPGASEKPSVVAAEGSSLRSTLVPGKPNMGLNAELFSILANCECSKSPGKSLLERAEELHWPLLAVVASCFTDVTPQSCLTTWLEITVRKEASVNETTDAAEQILTRVGAAVKATNTQAGSDSGFRFSRRSGNKRLRLSPEEEAILPSDGPQAIPDESTAGPSRQALKTEEVASSTGQNEHPAGDTPTGVGDGGREQESLAALVATLCEQQRFLLLLRAFELFTPTSSFLPFLRFLQAFSQMRISEASAHLAAFTTRLKEEMHQQHLQNRSSSKGSTAWITRAAIAAADAMHGACPSAYERRCLLQLLSGSDFGDGGMAAMRFRRLYWKIQLAEPALQEGSDPVTDGANLDDKALFDTLEKSTQWEQARSWARQLDPIHSGAALDRVTETQAEAMVTEWKELLWDVPEERVALWSHCQALFTMHDFPPLQAGEFFLKHADAVEPEISSSELHNILLVALQWLSGSISNSPPVYPLHRLHELETRVWLLAVESSVETEDGRDLNSLALMKSTPVGGLSHEISAASPIARDFVDRTAATLAVVDSHLKRFTVNKSDRDELARAQSLDTATTSSPAKPIPSPFKWKQKGQGQQKVPESSSEGSSHVRVQSEVEQKDAGPGVQPGDNDDVTSGGRWEERVGERELELAVLALLEVGQVTAAQQLQQKLSVANVPLEFSLVGSALKVAALPPSTLNGSVISSAVQSDVMEYIQTSGLLEDISRASPIEVLEVLTEACREGCGRGLCRRIAAIARIADVLGLSFSDAFGKPPTELLQLLALKGQDALAEAKVLVATHSILPASAARILAESFLKGLLAAHRGGYMESSQKEEGPAPLLWRPSDFVRWAQVCSSEPEIGHALMRLVISGRDMPHACEVELIILAYRYYESSACLDGVDVLVALAANRVDSYLSEGDYSSLARLVTGISNFQALHFILDFLIENGQLQLLLLKRSVVDTAMESSASIRGFRMAVLSALKHFNPQDLDAFAMVYSHFSMAHEMAALLESRGSRTSVQLTNKQYDPEQSEESLDMMRFYVEAAKVYSGIDAGNKTKHCCAQASLISLQLRMPDRVWLNLTDTNARRLLVEQTRFQESLMVAEAYGLNQSAEWVPVIWNHMLLPGKIDEFLNDFVAALPLTHSMLVELARFYRSEVLARGEQSQLDFSKWLSPGGITVELARHQVCFRSLLKHTRDMKERVQLATVATGFPDVIDACLKNIDNMPVTSGPLILRKGHGGTYVPIM